MHTTLLLIGGLFFLFAGGEGLVRGAVTVGQRLAVSPLLIGMVIVGFGTSTPELVVSVEATRAGSPALAVGNVIGSNISNVLFILAVAVLLRPIPRPDRVMVPDGIVLLLVSVVVVLLGLQGVILKWQGVALLSALFILIAIEYLRAKSKSRLAEILQEPMPLPAEVPDRTLVSMLLVITGIAGLVFGADMLVDGATRVARALGVGEGLIGLTIVAIGTSLPELSGSVVAALRGHTDVAYGNIIGSNLFNLLGILGVSALVGNLEYPFVMVWFDGPIMVIATAAMLFFTSTGVGLSRKEGTILLVSYVAYVVLRYAYALA